MVSTLSKLLLLLVNAFLVSGSTHQVSRRRHVEKRAQTYSGRATWYAAGLGACGGYNSGSDFIVAINEAQYGPLGQRSSWCGKQIAITANGKTQMATVVDVCPGCPYGALDMSQGLFSAMGNLDDGVFQISWHLAGEEPGKTSSRPKPTPKYTPPPTTHARPASTTWTPRPTTSSERRVASSSSSKASSSSSSSAAPQVPPDTNETEQEEDTGLLNLRHVFDGLSGMAEAARN